MAIDGDRRDVGRFFDDLTDDYTQVIERCFPRYREMLQVLLEYLPAQRTFTSILELGCGTGNLTVLLRAAFPQSAIRVVDVSAESLGVCQSRLGSDVAYEAGDFRELAFDPGSFDLVISSIAIHHLQRHEKQSLFQNIQRWLSDDGIFTYADQCAGGTQDLYDRHMELWKAQTMQAGSSEDEWRMWMEHQTEHDHHDSLVDQIDWLRATPFSMVDCTWRCLLWSVIQARK